MKSPYKISSQFRYGIARAKKLDPRLFISSINIQWVCRHAALWCRMLTLRALLYSVLAFAALLYLYGVIFSTSQSGTSRQSTISNRQSTQENTLLVRALKYSSSKQPSRSATTTSIIRKQRDQKQVVKDVTKMPLCDLPPGLGPISANTKDMALNKVEKKYHMVQTGGWYSPPNCTARHKVAIIVPYRDRKLNLAVFLNHMHPFLMKQRIEYGIFIVEQEGTHEFNRGKLLNVGFVESLKHRDWQCFIFHDIDMLPLDQRNLYHCPQPRQPRFLDVSAVNSDNENYKTMRSEGIFGGVTALTREQFIRANGYSNGYWGWGGEDDDLYHRLTDLEYSITQYHKAIARYTALKHKQWSRNPARYRILLQTLKTYRKDGLNKLQYQLVSVKLHHLYTHIVVSVDQSYHDLQELLQEQYFLRFGHKKMLGKVY